MIKHQEAFDALKEALCTAPVLGYPDFTREFILETNASLKGLGTILSQQQKDGASVYLLMQVDLYAHLKDQCAITVQPNWNY